MWEASLIEHASESGRCFWTPVLNGQAHAAEMPVQGGAIDVLRERVGGILRASNFVQREVIGLEFILRPQIRNRKVADFPQSAPAAYANGRGGIGVHSHVEIDAQIIGYEAEAKSLRGPAAYAAELSLSC